ncbi:hypothetical protein D7S86_25245 [Pararobbsia silviterrae]|uniref:Lipoprotein n=2 Tax=Pararobbsia silviterrae TaxID=1792498 RepID=A0A494X6A1_9BURK|nr:hypothetical protein D7S86_25245 [Pararobbsia silviterrae]
MSFPLCAAILVSGALAGCGDGASVATSQIAPSAAAPSQPAPNASTNSMARASINDPAPALSASHDTDPRSALATNAPIDPPSSPTTMSPGVVASVDPSPLVAHRANFTVFAAQSADNPEVQVQPVVHYAPDTSDTP